DYHCQSTDSSDNYWIF
nr:immunoglobulin light chain junction region [Macaca mulatta]